VDRKGAKRPIFEGETPPKKMYPQYWRRYWRHNRNPVKVSRFGRDKNRAVEFDIRGVVCFVREQDFSQVPINSALVTAFEEINEFDSEYPPSVFGSSTVAVVVTCHYGVHVREKQRPLVSSILVCCFGCFAVDLAKDDVTVVESVGISVGFSNVWSRVP
jgi:hypothetical protein